MTPRVLEPRSWTLLVTLLFLTTCFGSLPSARALQCYVGKYDCFPECTVSELDECYFINSDIAFNTSESDSEELEWSCARTFEECGSADCSSGLSLTTEHVEECAEGEIYCYDEFRQPQNNRYGKTAIWGFEAVHIRGCASECVDRNQSITTGTGVSCCTTDLCNSAPGRLRFSALLFVLCSFFVTFMASLPFSY